MPPKICSEGHSFFKSSACPVCPVCEKNKKPVSGFWTEISAPARRALESVGVKNEKDLSKYTEKQLLSLHGLGPSAIRKLKPFLKK